MSCHVDVQCTCRGANMCILVVRRWCVEKPRFGGGVKNGRFLGGSQKGSFLTPPGAQNFLHPPPGKPRQNIYYLDTRHPPGGGRFGGWFSDPPLDRRGRGVFWCHFCTPPPGCKNWDLDITGVAITNWTHHVL